MKPYEREFLIARIYNGYLTYESKAGYDLHIHSPTAKEIYDSKKLFQEAYNMAIVENILTEEDIREILRESNLWTGKHEELLKKIQDDIDKLKVGIFRSGFKKQIQSRLRKTLRSAEEKLTELITKKYMYTFVTCEGHAATEQLKWIVQHTTRHIDGSQYNWEHDHLNDVVRFYQREQLSDKDIREVAKNNEWRHVWSCSKIEGNIFGRSGYEMSTDQKTLITFSSMYDNVYESMDCPSDSVIEDDDSLDGWFITQRQKRDQQMKEAGMEDMVSNHGNANEIFIMTDDAKSVYELNDPVSKGIIKSRKEQVEEQGEVKYQNFGDVKRDIQMKASKQFSQTLKSRK